jgi:parallel beta-helix repeat protein
MSESNISIKAMCLLVASMIIASVVALSHASPIQAITSQPVTCGDTITNSIKLTTDIGPCPGDGIIMGTDNVTLNCNGHTLKGSGGIGIRVPADMNGITIRNCRVTEFATGFFIGGANNKLIGNLAANNEMLGFIIVDANNIELQGNVAKHNGNSGFSFDESFNIRIQGNTASHNGNYGYSVSGMSLGNDFKDNKAVENEASGFALFGSTNTILEANKATHNGQDGFLLFDGSDNNNLTSNKAVENAGNGFFINELSRTNKLQENTAAKNQLDGFHLSVDSTNNSVVGNKADNNVEFGYRDDSSSNSGTAGTANMYGDDRCSDNEAGGSNPTGLCKPQA